MTNQGVGGFPSSATAVPDAAVTSAKLAASLQATLTANLLTTGQETIARTLICTTGAIASQRLTLTYWTARKAELVTQTKMITGNTAAAATPTLCRYGLYSVDSYGNGTLVASTANDTTLFASGNTAYTKSFSSPYTTVLGQRYASAVLVVSGAAMPNFFGGVFDTGGTAGRAENALAPRLAGFLGSQADLPATFVDSGLSTWGPMFYSVVLP